MKLPVRLINTTNERRLVEGHETTPLRVKGDIEDISSEVDDGLERLHFLDETSRILVLSASCKLVSCVIPVKSCPGAAEIPPFRRADSSLNLLRLKCLILA
ncbi:hypothetical protein TNCV_2280482 [Trichonephila clavipes]|nr:hypothetical protein TNCV_2280482 [Trichonephila clavipes]